MKKILVLPFFICSVVFALPSYTGYSGAAGSKGTCASSCHGSGTGTITVTGFPSSYEPGKSYAISIQHSGGSTISNFNASTRIGASSIVAGTFTAGTKSVAYSVAGKENGMRASSNNIDAAGFTWTAPSAGTGDVTLYVSGLQGSKSGSNTKVVLTAKEQSATSVATSAIGPEMFELKQNYPNPFNPSTRITYTVPVSGFVTLSVYDIIGNKIAVLVSETKEAGEYTAIFDGLHLAGGSYLYQMNAGSFTETKRMVLIK